MKILVFLHGTLIMHKSAEGKSCEERVRQVESKDPSVLDYASYIHVGNAVEKLKSWQKRGAEILYLSSHETVEDVEKEMTIIFVKPKIKQKIKSIIVKEFGGIENLPNNLEDLISL